MLAADQPGIHGGAGGAHLAAQQVGQVTDQLELARPIHAAAARHDHRGVFQPDGWGAQLAAEHLQGKILRLEDRRHRFDRAPAGRVGFAAAHHALAYAGHLRASLGVDNGGNDVAAKGGADLVEQILIHLILFLQRVIANLQIGAVSRQADAGGAGNARRQVTPHRRSADQENVGLVLPHQVGCHAAVGQRAVHF